MKIWLLPANESWVCDRFVDEWYANNPSISTHNLQEADVLWLLSDWRWKSVPIEFLNDKKVVVTVHHIVPEKFGTNELADFLDRDQYVDAYHVPCLKTRKQITDILEANHRNKRVFSQPFWVNTNIWKHLRDGIEPAQFGLRQQIGIPDAAFLVGSFQRDTEGRDLVSPKLEKGPDIFCDTVIELHQDNPDVTVMLAGWRRQYVMKRLTEAGVPYFYEELPSFQRLNELYNMLDLYVVGSRYEGGPQAIVECAAIGVPIVSRDVGVASEILNPSSVSDDLIRASKSLRYNDDAQSDAYNSVKSLSIPGDGMKLFVEFFTTLDQIRSRFSVYSPGVGNRKTDV